MPLKICILQADDIPQPLATDYQSFGQMFVRLFKQQEQQACFEIYDVTKQQYPQTNQHYDAFLVTGSKADSFSSESWVVQLRNYLQQRYANGDCLLGICFGHQILALALGGLTERSDKGWGAGVHSYQMHSNNSGISVPKRLQLLISHKDQVTRLPEHAQRLASSDFCPNAAYVIKQQVLCFQGHPEFTNDFLRRLLESRRSIYTPEFYAQSIASLAQQHDGKMVGKWMMEFVAQARNNRQLKVGS